MWTAYITLIPTKYQKTLKNLSATLKTPTKEVRNPGSPFKHENNRMQTKKETTANTKIWVQFKWNHPKDITARTYKLIQSK